MSMTKKQLIKHIRILEHNINVTNEQIENQYRLLSRVSDDEIKRVSNTWMMYYLDYWNKKGTDKEYDEDPLCEEFPLKEV